MLARSWKPPQPAAQVSPHIQPHQAKPFLLKSSLPYVPPVRVDTSTEPARVPKHIVVDTSIPSDAEFIGGFFNEAAELGMLPQLQDMLQNREALETSEPEVKVIGGLPQLQDMPQNREALETSEPARVPRHIVVDTSIPPQVRFFAGFFNEASDLGMLPQLQDMLLETSDDGDEGERGDNDENGDDGANRKRLPMQPAVAPPEHLISGGGADERIELVGVHLDQLSHEEYIEALVVNQQFHRAELKKISAELKKIPLKELEERGYVKPVPEGSDEPGPKRSGVCAKALWLLQKVREENVWDAVAWMETYKGKQLQDKLQRSESYRPQMIKRQHRALGSARRVL